MRAPWDGYISSLPQGSVAVVDGTLFTVGCKVARVPLIYEPQCKSVLRPRKTSWRIRGANWRWKPREVPSVLVCTRHLDSVLPQSIY